MEQTVAQFPDFSKVKPSASIEKAEAALPRTGGTMTGAINMGGKKVTNMADPEFNHEAASKGYVDGRKSCQTVTLTTDGWENNSQTVNVAGVTEDNTVIVSPAPASWKAYCEAGARCAGQSAGTLTFLCEDVPKAELTANVLILK